MEVWIDAQLSPSLALWINQHFPQIKAKSVRSLQLLKANDIEIFNKAKKYEAVVMTKDDDFVQLLKDHGAPPFILLITCGNTSNVRMKEILANNLQIALDLIQRGEPLVEIGG